NFLVFPESICDRQIPSTLNFESATQSDAIESSCNSSDKSDALQLDEPLNPNEALGNAGPSLLSPANQTVVYHIPACDSVHPLQNHRYRDTFPNRDFLRSENQQAL